MTATELRSGSVAASIRRHRLVAVLRRVEPEGRLLALVDELATTGVRAFEITFDAPAAADDLRAVKTALASRSDGPFVVGAGTITELPQVDAARRAGADFGVAPTLDLAVVRGALGSGLPFVPGAMTPTEIATAWAAGSTFVKLFPASAVGPSLIRELHGPFPDIELIPTGGVDGTNASAFVEAGAVAVGIGGAIVRATADERGAVVRAVMAAGATR